MTGKPQQETTQAEKALQRQQLREFQRRGTPLPQVFRGKR